MEEGKWYLFCTPWDWTFIGQYVRHISRDELLVRNAGYFTKTGATFDKLCLTGFTADTKFHDCSALGEMPIPAQGPKFPWLAPRPWMKGAKS
jgi:hypothetical protein